MPQEERISRRVEEGAGHFRKEMSENLSVSRRAVNRSYEQEERYDNLGATMFDGGEIPQAPRPFVKPAPPRKLRPVSSASSSGGVSAASGSGVSVGQTIEHERFGIGEIVNLEGTGDNCKATVRFRNAGEKHLLLKFARFKIIG